VEGMLPHGAIPLTVSENTFTFNCIPRTSASVASSSREISMHGLQSNF